MDISAIPGIKNVGKDKFLLLAGPCVVESYDITFQIAQSIKKTTDKLKIPFVFKASYRKANRSKNTSYTGPGDIEALEILKEIKKILKLTIVTDIHGPDEAALASTVADILQIPAFLCRQTDLLKAAGLTGKIVNIKKGQFLSPSAMKHAVNKVYATGNKKVILTERGTTFGYHDLIVDYRGIPEMQKTGCPVLLDCTHSLQQPNQESGITGGTPSLISTIAKAGIAVGVNGLFIETHPDPSKALSDGANMLPLKQLEPMLKQLLKIRAAII